KEFKICSLGSTDDEVINEVDPFKDNRLIVDGFIKKKFQPTCEETKNWNHDMINYFKYQWEAMERQDKENSDEEDVFENTDQATQSFISDEIEGNVTDAEGGSTSGI
ncbi:hypothetical protein Tco_1536513, partial [Tanacetum coccineum]